MLFHNSYCHFVVTAKEFGRAMFCPLAVLFVYWSVKVCKYSVDSNFSSNNFFVSS